MKSRPGYARADVFTAVALSAALIGVAVPAIQKVRADAAKTTAKDNLKMIGLGAQNFHDANNRFPGNGVGGGKADELASSKDANVASFFYQVLPFVEKDALALYRFPDKATAAAPAVVKTYLDPERNRTGHIAGRPVTDFAVNPLALYGVASRERNMRAGIPPEAQTHVLRSGTVALSTMTDGSSNTILVGPKAMKPAEYNAADKDLSFLSMAATEASPATARATGSWPESGAVWAKMPAAAFFPEARSDSDPKLAAGPTDHFGGPGKGGVQFVFADGHVQTLSFAWLAPDQTVTVAEYTFGDPQRKATKVSQFRAALTSQGGEVFKMPGE
ncbi:MAG: DUF1559 domain-containing protein [Fimbriiglobus sp.]